MNPKHQPHSPDLHAIALALLELLDRPVSLELEQGDRPAALALSGTLLRAFDDPLPATATALTIMVGAHAVSLRLATIQRALVQRATAPPAKLRGIHLLLDDGYALHIKALP